MHKAILITIVILAAVGIVDSGYALKQHYAVSEISSCDINEIVSCTAVNQSEYSAVLGIPVAGIGVSGYLLIAGISLTGIAAVLSKKLTFRMLLASSVPALAISLWLTYVELFILKAVCPLCVISLAIITAITVLTAAGVLRRSRSRTEGFKLSQSHR